MVYSAAAIGAVREHAEIRQIEFRAGLGMQRDRVALSDAQSAAVRKRFLRRRARYSSQVYV